MKVLYSCLSRSWGGMEMFTVTAVRQLLNRGIETHLLCYPDSKIEISAKKEGIKTVPLKFDGYFNLPAIIKLKSILKKGNYDLIHTQASKDLWVLVPALRLAHSKIPLFLTKQVGSFISKKDLLHKCLYKRVTLAFAISTVIKKNLIDTTPLKADKIELLFNGVDVSKFDPTKTSPTKVRSEFKIKDDEIVIGMTARFTPGKGHEEFLEAAKILTGKFNNLRFLIVGEASRGEDEYAEKIYEMARNSGLSEKIIFTGFREDIPKTLAAMDIFVFPSHAEAFGIALAEALAMGKPAVCSDSDGALDICVDNETGFFFSKGSAQDLAEKITTLIEHPEVREKFAVASRKRAVEKFDIEKLTDEVIFYYKKFVK